jgi:hypothetical protein
MEIVVNRLNMTKPVNLREEGIIDQMVLSLKGSSDKGKRLRALLGISRMTLVLPGNYSWVDL